MIGPLSEVGRERRQLVTPEPHVGELGRIDAEHRPHDIPKIAGMDPGLLRRRFDCRGAVVWKDRLQHERREQVALPFAQEPAALLDKSGVSERVGRVDVSKEGTLKIVGDL